MAAQRKADLALSYSATQGHQMSSSSWLVDKAAMLLDTPKHRIRRQLPG